MEVASTYKFCPSCGGKELQVQQPSHHSQVGTVAQPQFLPQNQTYPPPPPVMQQPTFRGHAYASFWRRLGAYFIDYFIMLAAVVAISFPVGIMVAIIFPGGAETFGVALGAVIGILVVWLYPVLFESGPQQSTYGKRWLGMKVTDTNGQRISFGRANGRFFSKIISGLILAIGYLMVLWTERRQALHDKMADTYVLYSGGR